MKYKVINGLTGVGIILLIVFVVAGFVLPEEELEAGIQRSEYGRGEKTVSAVAEISYGEETVAKKVELKINPKTLSYEEKLRRLEDCKKELPEIILAGNKDTEHITEDMRLITFHEKTGVTVIWESENEELISRLGEVFPGEKVDNGYVLLSGLLSIDGEETEFKCNVRHTLKVNEENFEKLAARKLSEINDTLNLESDGEMVELPDAIGPGIKVKWKKPNDNKDVLIAFIFIVLMFFIKSLYGTNRRKKEEQRKEEILRELPGFMDKLVMLLYAGVILREAFERIAGDYKSQIRPYGNKVLYEEICISVDRMKITNAPLSEELTALTSRLEIREFARLAAVLNDSLVSGMELADKLENESELLRNNRKVYVQRLGKTADSKLVFPLMIMLMVLIVIVMAPAVMQM